MAGCNLLSWRRLAFGKHSQPTHSASGQIHFHLFDLTCAECKRTEDERNRGGDVERSWKKGTDGKDKPFIFLKRQSIRKKKKRPSSNQPEVVKKKDEYCINVCACVCFIEEVILADDENENDYDGIYAHKRAFLLCIIVNVSVSGCCCCWVVS